MAAAAARTPALLLFLPPALLAAATLLFFQAHAAAPAAAAPAPGHAKPLDFTKILVKASRFTTFLRLLKETQIGDQIENQLKNSYGGMTIFAPTDNAFDNLKPGTLNKLTAQQQSALILFHVLPRYYTLTTFQTASNPITTQATGNHGSYVVNVTSGENQLNVSTGVNDVRVNNAVYSTFPLAIYDIDSVLLPYDLFGPKLALTPSPKPSPKPSRAKDPSTSDGGAGSAVADSTSQSAAVRVHPRRASVGGVVLLVVGVGVGAIVM